MINFLLRTLAIWITSLGTHPANPTIRTSDRQIRWTAVRWRWHIDWLTDWLSISNETAHFPTSPLLCTHIFTSLNGSLSLNQAFSSLTFCHSEITNLLKFVGGWFDDVMHSFPFEARCVIRKGLSLQPSLLSPLFLSRPLIRMQQSL